MSNVQVPPRRQVPPETAPQAKGVTGKVFSTVDLSPGILVDIVRQP